MDSDLYPTVDWPYLRIWADQGGVETFYQVRLKDYATPIEGSYVCASAEFELKGTVTSGDPVGLAWMGEHHTHVCYGSDTLETAAEAITASVNAFSTNMRAERTGAVIRLTYVGTGQTLPNSTTGANGNLVGAYGHAGGTRSLFWAPAAAVLSGGQSPTKWRVTLPFGSLQDILGRTVPMQKVRKMRWTYAAAWQQAEYQRSEFRVVVGNWTVTGTNRRYLVAGPGSRRLEDSARDISYYGSSWSALKGNFSGGTIHSATQYGDSVTVQYRCPQNHTLYLGTRLLAAGSDIALRVDTESPRVLSLRMAGEDVLMRVPLGTYGPGEHTVLISHNGPSGYFFYFDFLEVAIPTDTVENQPVEHSVTLATDWDTDHSLAVPAERTAWMIHSLGFRGRVNHYVGALWFYELRRQGHQYASATIDFNGTPVFSENTQVQIGRAGDPGSVITVNHLNLAGDTAETICKAFELEFNRGYTALRAEASGTRLTLWSRSMGTDGNQVTVSAAPVSGGFSLAVSSSTLSGGVNGEWHTDLAADPRINRACRDWSLKFYEACKAYGLDMTAAFSLELQHGDPSAAAGIAQRYSNGDPCLLNTPALQTNFSPVSRAFWEKVHLQMADILAAAGYVPYMQFGEVQWWYFPNMLPGMTPISMPYYDQYTKDQFEAAHGFPMRYIGHNQVDPAAFPEEAAFLPSLIGNFTDSIIAYVRNAHPNARFEVLYPTDVNDTAWGREVNYPGSAWTPAKLDCLKTESFGFTFSRDLNKSKYSIGYGDEKGFSRTQRAFLVGPGDSSTTWQKEARIAKEQNLESIVLFALDQFCLIGYPVPLWNRQRSAKRLGP
jgi:hypothetical protein